MTDRIDTPPTPSDPDGQLDDDIDATQPNAHELDDGASLEASDDETNADAGAQSTPPRSSRTKAKSTQPSDLTCAFCGRVMRTTVSESVGGRPEIVYHDCKNARAAAHEWFLETIVEPTAKPPVFVKA